MNNIQKHAFCCKPYDLAPYIGTPVKYKKNDIVKYENQIDFMHKYMIEYIYRIKINI